MIERFRQWLWRWLRDGAQRHDLSTEIEPWVIRVSRVTKDGLVTWSVVKDDVISIRLTPIIEPGKVHRGQATVFGRTVDAVHKEPDRWIGYNVVLRYGVWTLPLAAGGDRHFEELLTGTHYETVNVVLEAWTKHIRGSAQDATRPWIHWLFTDTEWQHVGPGLLIGVIREGDSRGHALGADCPLDEHEQVPASGYWLTDADPPTVTTR